MAAYVLVGGAWLGGWCWQPVTRRLREAGHEVYPPGPPRRGWVRGGKLKATDVRFIRLVHTWQAGHTLVGVHSRP
jgi:hypothetical protein